MRDTQSSKVFFGVWLFCFQIVFTASLWSSVATNYSIKTVAHCTQNQAAVHLFLLADDHDESIGIDANRDVKNFEQSFSFISQLSKMQLKTVKFCSKQHKLNFKKVMRGIQKQAVGKDDVFIFYYSGHGYRKKNDPLFMPRISIKKEQKKDENFLYILKEIF